MTTPESPLDLILTLPPLRQLAGGQAMASRQMGRIGRVLILLVAPMTGACVLGTGIAWLIGLPLPQAGLVCLYAFLGTMAGLIGAQLVHARRYRRLFATSQMRALPTPLTLDVGGLTFHSRHLTWAAVSKTARWKDCTLLHFSAVDGLAIPDCDLPPGETHQTLAARIANWKSE